MLWDSHSLLHTQRCWFPNAPDVEKLLATDDDSDLIAAVEDITSYADDVVSTMNPAIAMDGSNPETAPPPKTKPQHSCNKPYSEVEDFSMDLVDLIATYQRHTQCSAAYCLRKKKASKNVALGTPNPCNRSPPSPQRTETPASSLQEMTVY